MGLVMVEWVDSHHTPGWTTGDPPTEPLTCRSVGWLVYEGERAITLAPHVTLEEEPQRCGQMTIPNCAILKIKKFEE